MATSRSSPGHLLDGRLQAIAFLLFGRVAPPWIKSCAVISEQRRLECVALFFLLLDSYPSGLCFLVALFLLQTIPNFIIRILENWIEKCDIFIAYPVFTVRIDVYIPLSGLTAVLHVRVRQRTHSGGASRLFL